MTEFLHLQKLGKKLQSTAWSSQILQHLEQFLKNWFLHSKLSNSTSTPALLFYKSTTFFSPNSTFYNFFLWKFYIYKHPKFLQFYNIFLVIFYILQWFFGPNLQSTFTEWIILVCGSTELNLGIPRQDSRFDLQL